MTTPTNSPNADDDLLRILADYSNDLASLKKRNGNLPAQAAVKRIGIIHAAQQRKLIDEILEKKQWLSVEDDFDPNMLESIEAISVSAIEKIKEQLKSAHDDLDFALDLAKSSRKGTV